ncbi:hypothetical protein C5167_042209 [Papaver somniferum]|uniref:NAC domain-containing protein n=1 Tax=Papaver somniferum TaxID=3469 RepID=A0A4Y7L271_PAPSO|nr:NAC domain-containing protein 100-like [Papaver somniferum]RZC79633.1 hypothetical protein C5167_042209 [Papaver somniferum]
MAASVSVINKLGDDQQMDLPPGFRFHPTDEELITHYLSHKVLDTNFNARAIGEVDLNKCEPWDLPWRAKMGEKEWYFFCVRDRKYPTGLRTNRATEAGYWKATGKDKEIYRGKTLVGMKKTLVFYKGRAPKGEKTNWVMHEYRLEGKLSLYNLPKTAKNEWVICRVFQKSSGGKKTIVTGLSRYGGGEELGTSYLPPLMDSSPFNEKNSNRFHDSILNHVTCFSNSMAEAAQKNQDDDDDNDGIIQYSSTTPNLSVNPSMVFSKNPFYDPSTQNLTNFQYPVSSGLVHQDHQSNILRVLLETHHHGSSTKQQQQQQNFKAERDQMISMSQETGLSTSTADLNNNTNHEISSNHHGPSSTSAAAGPVDLDCLFYY